MIKVKDTHRSCLWDLHCFTNIPCLFLEGVVGEEYECALEAWIMEQGFNVPTK